MGRIILSSCFVLLTATSLFAQQPVIESIKITSPPSQLQLDSFYEKYVDIEGLPIVSSAKVPDLAILEARRIVSFMIAKRNDLLPVLIKNRVRVAVMATSELTTDIPEHSDLTPKAYWDKRARGLGATHARQASSCAEENLLKYQNDPYKGENILIHEFAHTLHEMAISDVDRTFEAELQNTYASAMKRGLWKNTYSAANHKEYWAEGVQSWFNENKEVSHADGVHNGINTRRELRKYDPKLANLVSKWFVEH